MLFCRQLVPRTLWHSRILARQGLDGTGDGELKRIQSTKAAAVPGGGGCAPGEIACYVRENLVPFVSLVGSDCTNSFAVLRVNNLAGFEKEQYLIVTYIAPSSSSISVAAGNIWVGIEECVQRVLGRGMVLILGDQNARTGVRLDYPAGDLSGVGECLLPVPTCSIRRNVDQEVNAHGLKMLTLCKKTGLRTANGHTEGDREGAFTYFAPSGGASSVDYILACPAALTLIDSLQVVPAAFSDHYAIRLQVSTECSRVNSPRIVKVARAARMAGAANIKRWVEGVLPEFAEELGSIESSAHMAAANSTVELHALCDRFDTVLQESFGQVRQVIEGQGVGRQPIWFDHELALGHRAAHARGNAEIASVCNCPATTERVPDHAEKEARGS